MSANSNAREKSLFSYNGPVLHFDSVVADRWKAETMAVSEKQARSNLAFQFRKKNGFSNTYNVRLPAKVELRA